MLIWILILIQYIQNKPQFFYTYLLALSAFCCTASWVVLLWLCSSNSACRKSMIRSSAAVARTPMSQPWNNGGFISHLCYRPLVGQQTSPYLEIQTNNQRPSQTLQISAPDAAAWRSLHGLTILHSRSDNIPCAPFSGQSQAHTQKNLNNNKSVF